MVRVAFTRYRDILAQEYRYHASLSACVELLNLKDAIAIGEADRKAPGPPGFVVVEVGAEEATGQFPEGTYIAPEPSEDARRALFESQY